MKRFILILIIVSIILSCEEIPNETIEPEIVRYTVLEISAPIFLVFSENDNSISSSVIVDNTETVKNIWFDINTIDGLEQISSSNPMISGENSNKKTYTGKAVLDANLLSGKYEIEYYLEDNIRAVGENIFKVGTKQFQYQSEVENFPPVISNLDIPIEVNKNIRFSFTITVSDPNGLSDIKSVYYQIKDPGGNLITNSQGISKFPLFDDGNTSENSDLSSNDGIYSVFLQFPTGSQSGNWDFNFNAVDQAESISNTITHSLKVN